MNKEEINLKDYRRLYYDMPIGLGIVATISLVGGILFLKPYQSKPYEPKTLQISSFEDNDNIQGYDTIKLEDGRTFKIEEIKGKLSLLEQLLEKAK